MANETTTSPAPAPAPRKGRRWLKIIAWIGGVFLLLAVILYFVATSAAFLKGIILPKVSAAMNAKVTVSDASLSPFHQVVLRNLKVQTTGTEPLLTAPEVRLRYSLMDIIGGNIHVDEITLSSPTIVLVENPDGTSNLDPLLKGQEKKPAAPPTPAQPAKPLKIDVKHIALTDATIRQVKLYKGNNRDTTELSHVNVTIDDVKNGQTGKLTLAADVSLNNNPPQPGTSGLLQAKVSGNFTFAISADLKPASIQGNTKLAVSRAEGALAQVAGFGANFDCEVTPTDVKQVALRFQRGDVQLGELRVSGPFNMEKTEGKLTVELNNIDKNLLDLAGASSGASFGPTTISCTNQVDFTKGGANIAVAGQFDLHHFQLTRTNQTTPPLDLRADYSVIVDRSASSALLQTLTLTGTQKEKPLLHGELTSPMTVAWGNNANVVGDSALNIALTHLDLADWKPFTGDAAPVGDVNFKVQLLSQQAGKKLSFDVNGEIDNLTAGAGSNRITQATVTLVVKGQAADLKQFSLSQCQFQVSRQNQPLVTSAVSGTYDQDSGAADLQVDGQLMLARLLQAFPAPNLSVASGSAALKGHLVQKDKTRNITGTFTLADFTGKMGSNTFQNYGVTADLDVAVTPQQAQIRKLTGTLTEGANAGGSFDVSGAYDLTNKSAKFTANVTGLNQDGLRPFLEPMLADKKLVSVALNAHASADYQPQGASGIKADLQMTNLVVNDPKGQFPATPLAAGLALDASLKGQVADVRQFQVSLTPTARGTNQVQLTGHIDMSRTNATEGNLQLTADTLDLTSYYDLFGGQQTSAAKPAASGAARPATTLAPPAAPEKEPDATQLPLRNFTAAASVRRLYLHELEVADFVCNTKIDGGRVSVNPFKLSVNGAPVSSTVDLDLGVPGYKYDVAFNAQAVPLTPLVDSVRPQYKGVVAGTFTAQGKLTGAGTTGASLQKNLNGQFELGSTNLNLSVDKLPDTTASRPLKLIVEVVASIPELAKNPIGGASSVVQSFVGGGTGSGGNSSGLDLKKSPVDSIVMRGNMGSGKVNLQQAMVQSPAFRANITGTITLDPVLTNSPINLPVGIELERGVAQKLSLLPANAPANITYAALPDFFSEVGTLGNPKKHVDPAPLIKAVLERVGGNAGQASGLLQGLGGILGGKNTTTTNAPANQASTNQSPVGNLLNQFLKPKK